ncbi:MAG TPA: hypothetical protein PL028_05190 [Bacteroidales bacterium]|nr:hypothetical protein [Bacteroidales bacterium]
MKKIAIFLFTVFPFVTFASEADLKVPEAIKNENVLYWGFLVCLLGLLFGLYQFMKVKKLPAHKAMLDVSDVIYKTCSAYLKKQGKFIAILFLLLGHLLLPILGF